jgi:AraC-like DNA-binding protein
MRAGKSLTIEAVEKCIRASLPKGYPSLASTAAALDTSTRTLQRHLWAAGVTYGQLVDRIRLDVARRLIEESDKTMQDIATSLGYSEPGSLSRLVGREMGVAPSVYRRRRRREAEKI